MPKNIDIHLAIQGFDSAHVVSWEGQEGLSKLYRFDVDLEVDGELVPTDPASEQPGALGQRVLVKIGPPGEEPRRIRGVVARVEPREETSSHPTTTPTWRVRLKPTLWLAKHRVRSRIFRHLSVPDIVSRVVTSHEYGLPEPTLRLRRELPRRDFCMQYKESDYAFVRRILSEEGIAWYLDHPATAEGSTEEGGPEVTERMVLIDAPPYAPLRPDADSEPVTLAHKIHGSQGVDDVPSFTIRERVRPTAVQLRDRDPANPARLPQGSAPATATPGTLAAREGDVEGWSSWSSLSRGGESRGAYTGDATDPLSDEALRHRARGRERALDAEARRELRVYEHSHPLGPDRVDDGLAQIRLEQLRRGRRTLAGSAEVYFLEPGKRVRFEPDPHSALRVEGEYAVTTLRHRAVRHPSGAFPYELRFDAVAAHELARPKRREKVRHESLESATVVGPAGHAVHVDEQGRIKIQFHWDREHDHDDESSCWVRLMNPWAGSAFGAQFVPRVGSEVLVAFLDGDHDRPVVLGGVYNGSQPLPFAPPEGKLRSGFRTQSVPGGSGYNELSFDDTSGSEQVRLRAEADLETFVGRDRKTRVVGSEVSRVEGRRTDEVKGDVETRVEGDTRHHVDGAAFAQIDGTSRQTVKQDWHLEVEGAARHRVEGSSEHAVGASHTLSVEGHLATKVGGPEAVRSSAVHVEGMAAQHSRGMTELVAEAGLRLRCGTSIVEIMEDQILLRADRVMLHHDDVRVELDTGGLWVDGDEVAIKGDTVKLRGEGSMLALDAEARLMGPKVSLCRPEALEGLEPVSRELTTIELCDEDGEPMPHQRFVLVFEDGREQTGFLDGEGRAELILEEGAQVRFPGLLDARNES